MRLMFMESTYATETLRHDYFTLLHIVQTGSGVHPTSYKMGTGGKAAGS
jgi:hypothetical protein